MLVAVVSADVPGDADTSGVLPACELAGVGSAVDPSRVFPVADISGVLPVPVAIAVGVESVSAP